MTPAAVRPAGAAPKARGWRRIAVITLVLLVLLAVGATVALRQAFPPERLAALLAAEVQAATGRGFAIRGTLSLRVLPSIAVVAEDVRLANVAWGTRPDMLNVRKIVFEAALRPLLSGTLGVQRVVIDGAQLWLETDAQGRGNWAFDAQEKPTPAKPEMGASAAARSAPALTLGALEVTDTQVTVHSARVPGDRVLRISELSLKAQGADYSVKARLDLGGGPAWAIDGQVGGLAALGAGAQDWPFDLQVGSTGLQASAKGELALGTRAGDLRVALRGELKDTAALQSLVKGPLDVPLPIQLSATLQRSGAALHVAPIELTVQGQALSAEVHEAGQNPPHVKASVSAAKLDLGALRMTGAAPSAQPAAKTPAAGGPLFSRTPLALPAALPFAIDLSLDIGELRLPSLPPVTALKLQARAEPGRLAIGPARFGIAQGQAEATAQLDLGATPQVRVKFDARDLAVDAVSAALHPQGAPVRQGRLQLALDLTARGNSPHALAASVSGPLLLSARGMVLKGSANALGTDLLVSLLRALSPGKSVTQDSAIACAVLRLPLRQGVAEIDRSIALESDHFNAAAVGRLDLGNETVSMAVRPVTKGGIGLSAANLSSLVRLEGPLASPKLVLDTSGALREAANVGTIVATAGLSVLAGKLVKKSGDGIGPCEQALGVKR